MYIVILDEVALIVLPTLLGMVWAFQGKAKWRIEQLELVFTGQSSGFMETSDHLPIPTASADQTNTAASKEVEFLKQYATRSVTLKTRQVEKLMKKMVCFV